MFDVLYWGLKIVYMHKRFKYDWKKYINQGYWLISLSKRELINQYIRTYICTEKSSFSVFFTSISICSIIIERKSIRLFRRSTEKQLIYRVRHLLCWNAFKVFLYNLTASNWLSLFDTAKLALFVAISITFSNISDGKAMLSTRMFRFSWSRTADATLLFKYFW